MISNEQVRNVAIIAHVDHGKTTLIDAIFRQSGLFRENQNVQERLMDNLELERERGITIAAKNCAVRWKGAKINIIDTPGHADFGGEVERSISMADGALLLVDASEGPLPQTRFVLKKTLEAGLKILVVINKIDRKDARPKEVLNEIYDLFIDLDVDEEQLGFSLFYAIGRDGVAQRTLEERGENLHMLLDAILEEIPAPTYNPGESFRMLVSDLGYSDYLGQLAIGRVVSGTARASDNLVRIDDAGAQTRLKVTWLATYDGPAFIEVASVDPGDIIVLSGLNDVCIGDTICTVDAPKALKRITVEEPTVAMHFMHNTSPLAIREGRFAQSNRIRERLIKETLRNVAIRMEEARDRDVFEVKGRGEFQMAILVETMRREGYELTVGRPEVILRDVDGKLCEPIEHVYVDCDEIYLGSVTEKLAIRKGRMLSLVNKKDKDRVRIEFTVPSRGLIGYRNEFLTDTKGTGIMNTYILGYEPYRGDFSTRNIGSIVADRSGVVTAYAIFNLESRGELFIGPGDLVYEGMIVGKHNRNNDINVNPCKEKKLTNMRAVGKGENVILTPVQPMTLERAIHFIREDEQVEITPTSIRLRKTVLSASQRHMQRGATLKSEG
ncbi:50S ribosomal subunit assembly factor BipA [Desulfovibrionales bacterium]